MDHESSCPDPELLSAFLDAGLDPAAREAVAHHLAQCDSCRGLVADVVRAQDLVASLRPELVTPGAPPARPDRRHRLGAVWRTWRLPVTMLAGALALLAVTDTWVGRQQPDAQRVRLAEGAGRERTVEARLSGPFPHAPLRPPTRSRDGETIVIRPWMLVAAAGEIRDAHHADLSAASQHVTGVAALLVGEYHEAIRALTAAADVAPADAGILADLAAAYHERARLGGRADDLPRALSAAERAIAADPARAEAWFNRALAVSAIAPRDLAREAWQAYLARETDPAWREEARQRIEDLTPLGDPWPVVLARLESTPSQPDVDAAVRQHTSRAREFLERDLLPGWAQAVLDGGDAQTPLDKTRMLADAFSRLTGDQLARDVVIAIDRAEAAGTIRALAGGVLNYVSVRRAAIESPGRLAAELSIVKRDLLGLDLPMHVEAAIDEASAYYYSGRYTEADQTLAEIELVARRGSYSDVLAEATWLGGMVAFAQGRLGDAQYLYERTLEISSAMGDAERIASASLLLANLFDYVGDQPSAWRFRTESAAFLITSDSPRIEHGLLISAAGNASRTGSPEASLVFQAAALRTAASINGSTEAEVRARRAGTLQALNRHTEAVQELVLANDLLEAQPPTPLRDRVRSLALETEAQVFSSVSAARAIDAAREALDMIKQRGDRLRVAQLSLALSRAFFAKGDLSEAEALAQAGIATFDEERRSLSTEGRIAYSEQAWELFEQAIHLALAREDRESAFAYSERGRARTIVETRQWSSEGNASLAQARGVLSPGDALLIVNQFENELVSWLVRPWGVSSATVPLSRAGAETLVAAYSNGITTGGGGTHASGELFDAIVRPHLAAMRDTKLLVIVPDSPYSSVAFAGLMDRRRSRFLIEDVALAVSPSATVFVRAMARAAARPARPLSALILGAAATSSGGRMAALPAARNEAGEIAALYASAELRAGAAATPARLLDDGPRRDVVHVAAHGMTNAEYPLLSRLMLADLPGRPHSGAVFASEVAARDFSGTSLVVLAACDSGGGPEARGEGALSLARAFLAAGVPTVVSALGPLDDTLARQMFVDFHRAYRRGASAAESLQQVQVQALQRTGRQPGAWARLAVFGASHTNPQDRTEGDSREP